MFKWIGLDWRVDFYSIWGLVFVFGIYYAPYVYMFTASALGNMDPSLEEAAEISLCDGHSKDRCARPACGISVYPNSPTTNPARGFPISNMRRWPKSWAGCSGRRKSSTVRRPTCPT